MISKKFFVACAFTFFLLATTSTTYGFAVSGVSFEPTVAPGEHIKHEMGVSLKESDDPQEILIDIYDWNQTIQGDDIIAEESSKSTFPYSTKSILKASPTSFHLDPGGSQKVLLEGDIPTDAKAGGRYAIVSVHTVPNSTKMNSSETTNINMAYAINVIVLIKISGEEIKTGEITDLVVNEPVSSKHQNVTMIFKNTGNYHYEVDAEAYLKDKDGKVLANATMPLNSYILPTFSRLFQFFLTPETELKPGSYNVSAKISLKNGTVLATKNAQFKIKS